MAWPYRRVQQEMGLRRTLENWTVTSSSYLASPSHVHQWVLSWFSDVKFHELATAYLFPGILPVGLAVAAFLRRRDSRLAQRGVVLYGLLALVSVLLFIDGPLALWPWVYWWPGMNFIRAPSRFMILTTLCLAVLAGAGFERIVHRWTTPVQRALTVAVALLLLAEFNAYPFSGTGYSAPPPAVDRWLASQPTPFVVAEVPLPDPRNSGRFERFQTMAMLHSMAHWQKTVHGYSGFRAPFHEQLYLEMRALPGRGQHHAAARGRGDLRRGSPRALSSGSVGGRRGEAGTGHRDQDGPRRRRRPCLRPHTLTLPQRMQRTTLRECDQAWKQRTRILKN